MNGSKLLLRLNTVAEMLNQSRSQIYKLIQDGTLPNWLRISDDGSNRMDRQEVRTLPHRIENSLTGVGRNCRSRLP